MQSRVASATEAILAQHFRHLLNRHCGYLETWRRIGVWPDSVQVLDGTLSHCGCPPALLVWLSHGMRSRRAPCEERLERGLSHSK
jgi:hypothetical protein